MTRPACRRKCALAIVPTASSMQTRAIAGSSPNWFHSQTPIPNINSGPVGASGSQVRRKNLPPGLHSIRRAIGKAAMPTSDIAKQATAGHGG